MFYKNRYIQSLELRISVLEKSLADSERYNRELVARLMRKENVPEIIKPISDDAVQSLLRTADVFQDIEDDEIEDTRKDKLDAFAS